MLFNESRNPRKQWFSNFCNSATQVSRSAAFTTRDTVCTAVFCLRKESSVVNRIHGPLKRVVTCFKNTYPEAVSTLNMYVPDNLTLKHIKHPTQPVDSRRCCQTPGCHCVDLDRRTLTFTRAGGTRPITAHTTPKGRSQVGGLSHWPQDSV